jgi:tetratricopeptide (TPR) repeat protein
MLQQFSADESLQFALAHHRDGRFAEAEAIYRQVLAGDSRNPQALNLLGTLAMQTGRLPLAADLLGRAIEARPEMASFHCNLGEAYRRMEQLDDAIAHFRRAIELDPSLAMAQNNLGLALGDREEWPLAAEAFRAAIELQPDCAPFHSNLGNVLKEAGDLDAAVAELERAVELDPASPESHNNLGVALAAQDRADEAIASYLRAVQLNPRYGDAFSNLGNALFTTGDYDRAVKVCRTAVSLAPDSPAAHWNLAVALLRTGNFEAGWPEHEWRLRTKLKFPVRPFPQPQWRGEPLAGRTIFLHAEQGFGDGIQYVRYVKLVAERGGRIILECHPELRRLFEGFPGTEQVLARGEPLPDFDLHCPLASLPFACRTRLETIPADVPYLSAQPDLARAWTTKLGPAKRPRVGIVWAGNPTHPNDRVRSVALKQLAPLARANVEFHSLQKAPSPAAQAFDPAVGLRVIDHHRELTDYIETAALISCCDLVIAVDTSVAHLAGALGATTWVLIPFVADCRWLVGRDDSPWYPTMRLFRQLRRDRWDDAIDAMAHELARWASSFKR